MLVSNIQRFSLDDGPGIRTTIFLAGCNMRCLWCHNPENFEGTMLAFNPEVCTGCRRCEQICPEGVHHFQDSEHRIQWDKCRKCFRCINVCEKGAIFSNSKDRSVTELMTEIEKDLDFYSRSSGGVTFSGGEPVLWSEELKEILAKCKKKGIHTAVETAGNYPFHFLDPLLKYTDLILMDCKAWSKDLHQRLTGQSNQQILSNIQSLSDFHKNIWIRIPVVWNINITFEQMEKIACFLEGKQIQKAELIPYHKMGIGKYKTYGQTYILNNIEVPDPKTIEECYRILKDHNIPV